MGVRQLATRLPALPPVCLGGALLLHLSPPSFQEETTPQTGDCSDSCKAPPREVCSSVIPRWLTLNTGRASSGSFLKALGYLLIITDH